MADKKEKFKPELKGGFWAVIDSPEAARWQLSKRWPQRSSVLSPPLGWPSGPTILLKWRPAPALTYGHCSMPSSFSWSPSDSISTHGLLPWPD